MLEPGRIPRKEAIGRPSPGRERKPRLTGNTGAAYWGIEKRRDVEKKEKEPTWTWRSVTEGQTAL